VGDLDTVKCLFADKVVPPDLREGETSLSDLWFDFQERRLGVGENIPIDDGLRARVRRDFPLPKEFDFRMSGD